MEERAAIIQDGADIPRARAEAFARLDIASRPPACSEERLRQIIDAAGMFLDRWGTEAARPGWPAIDVFGMGTHGSDFDGIAGGLRGVVVG